MLEEKLRKMRQKAQDYSIIVSTIAENRSEIPS